jgi:hypothetical protein
VLRAVAQTGGFTRNHVGDAFQNISRYLSESFREISAHASFVLVLKISVQSGNYREAVAKVCGKCNKCKRSLRFVFA